MDTSQRPAPLAYSINDACKVLGIGRTYLYQLISEGRVRACKLGKRTLIPAASLNGLVEEPSRAPTRDK